MRLSSSPSKVVHTVGNHLIKSRGRFDSRAIHGVTDTRQTPTDIAEMECISTQITPKTILTSLSGKDFSQLLCHSDPRMGFIYGEFGTESIGNEDIGYFVEMKLHEMDVKDLHRTICGLSRLSILTPRLTAMISDRISPMLFKLSIQELCALARATYSSADLNVHYQDLLVNMSTPIAARILQANSTEIAAILTSYAEAGILLPEMMNHIVQHVIRISSVIRPNDVVSIIHSVCMLRYHDIELLERLRPQILKNMRNMTLKQITRLAYSYSQLGLIDSKFVSALNLWVPIILYTEMSIIFHGNKNPEITDNESILRKSRIRNEYRADSSFNSPITGISNDNVSPNDLIHELPRAWYTPLSTESLKRLKEKISTFSDLAFSCVFLDVRWQSQAEMFSLIFRNVLWESDDLTENEIDSAIIIPKEVKCGLVASLARMGIRSEIIWENAFKAVNLSEPLKWIIVCGELISPYLTEPMSNSLTRMCPSGVVLTKKHPSVKVTYARFGRRTPGTPSMTRPTVPSYLCRTAFDLLYPVIDSLHTLKTFQDIALMYRAIRLLPPSIVHRDAYNRLRDFLNISNLKNLKATRRESVSVAYSILCLSTLYDPHIDISNNPPENSSFNEEGVTQSVSCTPNVILVLKEISRYIDSREVLISCGNSENAPHRPEDSVDDEPDHFQSKVFEHYLYYSTEKSRGMTAELIITRDDQWKIISCPISCSILELWEESQHNHSLKDGLIPLKGKMDCENVELPGNVELSSRLIVPVGPYVVDLVLTLNSGVEVAVIVTRETGGDFIKYEDTGADVPGTVYDSDKILDPLVCSLSEYSFPFLLRLQTVSKVFPFISVLCGYRWRELNSTDKIDYLIKNMRTYSHITRNNRF